MSTKLLEKDVAELKERVAVLESKLRPAGEQTWLEIIGMLPDDELTWEAARLGEEWRATENEHL